MHQRQSSGLQQALGTRYSATSLDRLGAVCDDRIRSVGGEYCVSIVPANVEKSSPEAADGGNSQLCVTEHGQRLHRRTTCYRPGRRIPVANTAHQ